jgi:apolipoprotein D and lipocalin family protein
LLVFGCVGVPQGVQVVEDFEVDRYLGTWYEIARLDHPFERGLSDITATYTLREEGGISVLNRGYDPERESWREATGKAFFVGEETSGRLKVSFFGPFYGGYNLIALDREGYRWAMVAGPDRSFLWILARTPTPDPATVERLVSRAEALGFPVADLIFVSHRDAAAGR